MNSNRTTALDKLAAGITATSARTHGILLLLVLALGFALRLHGLLVDEGFREFATHDEMIAYRFALAFLAGEMHTWYLGQPEFSGGLAPGPMWTLFWVLLYKLGGSTPFGAMFWMLTLNTFVIYLVYRFARTLLDRDYALLTALLYATGAWPLFYSTIMWNPVPMALLGITLYLSLWRTTRSDRSRSVFLVCVTAAVMPQFHMIGLFYYPAILLILYLGPARVNRKWFAAGILAGILVYLPYLIGEVLNHWANTVAVFSKNLPASFGVAKIITTPVGVLSNQIGRWTGYGFEYYREFGDAWFGSYLLLMLVNVVSLIISLVFIAHFLAKAFRAMRGNWLTPRRAFARHPAHLFIGIFLLLPPLLFLLTGHNYGSRYTIVLFPLLFLLPAFFLHSMPRGRVRTLFSHALAFMVLFNSYLYIAYNHHLDHRIEYADYFAPSFSKMEAAYAAVREQFDRDVRLELDAHDYITDTPETWFIGGVALAGYFEIAEQYLAGIPEPARTVTLRLVPDGEYFTADDRVIYRTNGMAVIERK